VLAEVRKRPGRSRAALVKQIAASGHLDFTRFKAGSGRSVEVVTCSDDSIGAVIDICENLKLVDSSSGELSAAGLRAAEPQNFDDVLRRSIGLALDSFGTPLSEIRKVIVDMLSECKRDTLPTCDTIYDRMGRPEGTRGLHFFRTHLSLLSACDGIAYTRKKLYLP